MIAEERLRQVSQEGWSPEHDDKHVRGDLAFAAVGYAQLAGKIANVGVQNVEMASKPWCWPWAEKWWKPSEDPVRNLVKAGALIAAEIDRLQRQGGKAAKITKQTKGKS